MLAFSFNQKLTKLILSNTKLNDPAVKHLADALNAIEVCFRSDFLSPSLASHYNHSESHFNRLFSEMCVRQLLESIGDCHYPLGAVLTFKSTNSLANILENNQTHKFAHHFIYSSYQNIEWIDLSANLIGDEGVKYLVDALVNSQVLLPVLSMIPHVIPVSIIQTIRKLNLDSNRIGDEGAQYLAKMLKVNKVKVNSFYFDRQIFSARHFEN